MTPVHIRSARKTDHEAVWAILEPVFRAGDTYTIDPEISAEDALAYWCGPAHSTFVAEAGGVVLGTYYLRQNQGGGGGHVCNCGYVTAPAAQGKGIARAMLTHSLTQARRDGYRAMQYNFVVATNRRAISTWERAGFRTVGRLPGAFDHPREGMVDALVMWREL
ncbi:MAG: GNAT family N-acetyltransferase [Pseudomonadota bacterium]